MIQSTSLWSYQRIIESGLISRRRAQVYAIVAQAYPKSLIGSEIARIFHERHGRTSASETVRNRLTELRDMGLIECLGYATDGSTKMTVMTWRLIVGAEPRKLEKAETSREKIKRLQDRVDALEAENAQLRDGRLF